MFIRFPRNPNGNANVPTLPGRERRGVETKQTNVVNADPNVVMPGVVQDRRHDAVDKDILSHDAMLGYYLVGQRRVFRANMTSNDLQSYLQY